MNEMVERVKQAIRAELIFEGDYDPASFEDAARAAIAAMREPTDWMIIRGCRFTLDDGPPVQMDSAFPVKLYRAMIDAALKPNDALIEQHRSAR